MHTAQKPQEHAILWLNVPLASCGVMRVNSTLYMEVALLQQFLGHLVCLGVSHKRLSEVMLTFWITGVVACIIK